MLERLPRNSTVLPDPSLDPLMALGERARVEKYRFHLPSTRNVGGFRTNSTVLQTPHWTLIRGTIQVEKYRFSPPAFYSLDGRFSNTSALTLAL
ncbi:hypothetical protein TNIN_396121 [Trichonephila inaurata madagascariensis]|uniref:Uncharacterized protein n=1 Tax=Trichonephila inaurata madagascariensis TaxID=2747483 RepID=A0A8X7BTW4_9ARAC|nr:hypothetical protein TNIN_396121 [Trichonephila inaurata madagascariensis]